MVKVRKPRPKDDEGWVDILNWREHILSTDNGSDYALLSNVVDDFIKLGEGLEDYRVFQEETTIIASVLEHLALSEEVLCAGILYPACRRGLISTEEIGQRYGDITKALVVGAKKMEAISAYHDHSFDSGSTDNLRRMLLAMIDDVRVVYIKLAEQVAMLRLAKLLFEPEERYRIAGQAMDIYAPLANRLGIGQLKWELEDLSFFYLHTDTYKKIAKLLDEKRLSREDYINQVVDRLRSEMEQAGIEADISGRPKHIYSIWKKMSRKGAKFEEIYDVRAVRIMTDHVKDCYAALGIVHGLWRHIPKEFDDYITNPKENGYQSLHTAVYGPEGKVVEIQIRTNQMHSDAENGVAAHWNYKEGVKRNVDSLHQKINWLRQLLEWQDEFQGDTGEFFEALSNQVFEDRVYVFTPRGEVKDLPLGATPIDFAYAIHSDIGDHCRGAKVNGRIVPLNYQLQQGDQVSILTGPNAKPSRDWLNVTSGFVKSQRTRGKIQQWFKKEDRDQNLEAGRLMLEKELRKIGLKGMDLQPIAARFNYPEIDELLAGIGAGDVRINQVVHYAEQLENPEEPRKKDFSPRASLRKSHTKDEIVIHGVGNLLTQMAGCCNPVPGEEIVGYISQNRGVIIHRKDCQEAILLDDENHDRIIEVEWGSAPDQVYPVTVVVKAYDRSGLLRDIMNILADRKVNITSVNTISKKQNHTAHMQITMEIQNLEQLSQVLNQMHSLPNVMEVERQR